MGERLLSSAMILLLYFRHKRNGQNLEKRTELLLKAYMCGVCTYVLLFGSSYYASRYCAIFKVLEGAVLLLLIHKKEWLSKIVLVLFFGLTFFIGSYEDRLEEIYGYNIEDQKLWILEE